MTFELRIMWSRASHITRVAVCLLVSRILANRVDTIPTRYDVIGATCPTNCSCANGSGAGAAAVGGSLVIDCRDRSIDDNSTLSVIDEIDMFLMNGEFDLTYQLNITRSSMTQVPSSVCRLSRLRKLFLSNNRLKILPKKCFDEMSALEEFHATDNELTELQVSRRTISRPILSLN